ncbi:DUF3667 domain-containing protein [Mucilaginibacter roseus]|uniref:DUF3667 domain-containing protein n=1 Tax=Mucilaginibacter roseus TaxID=1528868 RepID=A0ABS8TW84_9SPHI|nr:DUF3667 domain-containing protein [Mucilaginibacter roseus]MCD8739135.1 DUF3667 domain-containing protein [Mucilaginibacter roseus]
MTSKCLNCAADVTLNYCPQCGQKVSTHRYSIKHFVEHDLIHGVWHVDKGVLFTLKELFTRPGHGVREFIEGKRVNYFSFVTLILLIVTISTMLAPYVHVKMADLMPQQTREMMNSVEKFMSAHPKLVLIISIPIYSLFSFAWFNKARLNYSEHLVLNSYRIIPEMIFGLLVSIVTIFYTNTAVIAFLYLGFITLFSFLYSIYFYFQFFSVYGYSKSGLIFRSIMMPISYILLSFLSGIAIGVAK